MAVFVMALLTYLRIQIEHYSKLIYNSSVVHKDELTTVRQWLIKFDVIN